ncbi:hypothetical protein BC829DRAFT_492505 [Chytridium lagenaria]|nr:hypothetical protein BC829DRAFT_492505 [Chytridium lagenaria]
MKFITVISLFAFLASTALAVPNPNLTPESLFNFKHLARRQNAAPIVEDAITPFTEEEAIAEEEAFAAEEAIAEEEAIAPFAGEEAIVEEEAVAPIANLIEDEEVGSSGAAEFVAASLPFGNGDPANERRRR